MAEAMIVKREMEMDTHQQYVNVCNDSKGTLQENAFALLTVL